MSNAAPAPATKPLTYTSIDADLVKTMRPAGRAYYITLARSEERRGG